MPEERDRPAARDADVDQKDAKDAGDDDAPRVDVASAEQAPVDATAVPSEEPAPPRAPETTDAAGEAEPAGSGDDAEVDVEGSADTSRGVALGIVLAVAVSFFFLLPPLSKAGLWDPYELNVADLARRIALNLFGATGLALQGAENTLPHLNDLGRPELPFTSMALGFKLFGLHEWAGRMPLAVWGVAGALATYAFVARLVDRRAGIFAALALTTMPLYFVQARTMMGEIVTMAAFAMAFGGLAVAVFDRRDDGPPVGAARVAFAILGVVGAVAGFYSRGALLGVAAPLLGVGIAWGVTWAAGQRRADAFGDAVAAIALGVGVVAAWYALRALGQDKVTDLSLAAGGMIKPPRYPTFDYYVGHIGHAAAPWSAFAPFAMGRLFLAPRGPKGAALERESFARVAILVGAAVAFAAHGWAVARIDLVPFTAPAVLAAACGVALRDYERGAHPSIAMAVGTAVFLGVLHHDFHQLPEKAYQAFGVSVATFPEAFKEKALALWTLALVGFALLGMLAWVERKADREPFDPATYLRTLRALRDAWDGMLALGYFAMVAGASIAGIVIFAGVRTKAAWVARVPGQVRDGVLNAWWVTAIVPLAVILGILFATDVWLWAFGRAPKKLTRQVALRGFEPFEQLWERVRTLPRGSGEWWVSAVVLLPLMGLALPGATFAWLFKHGYRPVVALALAVPSGLAIFLVLGILGVLARGRRSAGFSLAGVAAGLVLCFQYYPALAQQLSPKEVFESYERKRSGAEPLALLGVGGRTAAYYAGGQPETLSDGQSAFQWLVAGPERRWLAVRSEELGRLNMLYRQSKRENLPVLDARSSQILLVASSLPSGERNQNPLSKIVLDAVPSPQRKLDVNMDDKLTCLGFDITDGEGKFVEAIQPGKKFRMRTYYRVLAPVTSEWQAFIHIDGFHRRHNGDHAVTGGKYPFAYWLKGDVIVDDYEMTLEPNFTPGPYTIYFGLFLGETRFKILSQPNDGDNRIIGGTLVVQ
jgi:4-amino-4-deoxy-L-arabinose transferase-like glycosyltransferase